MSENETQQAAERAAQILAAKLADMQAGLSEDARTALQDAHDAYAAFLQRGVEREIAARRAAISRDREWLERIVPVKYRQFVVGDVSYGCRIEMRLGENSSAAFSVVPYVDHKTKQYDYDRLIVDFKDGSDEIAIFRSQGFDVFVGRALMCACFSDASGQIEKDIGNMLILDIRHNNEA